MVHKQLCIDDSKRVLALQNDAAQQRPELVFVRSGTTYLEISPRADPNERQWKHSKPSTVWAGRKPWPTATALVDEGMICYAELGVAMGNAPVSLKGAADRVTVSNDEEGIYIALKHLKFKAPPSQ